MTNKELKKIISECVAEVKLEKAIRNIIKESLKPMKIKKEHSLEAKMEELAEAVKSANKDARVYLDDAKRYNVCDCDPHHFSIYPVTDDSFNVTHFATILYSTTIFCHNLTHTPCYCILCMICDCFIVANPLSWNT